jgi:hypothetical protein
MKPTRVLLIPVVAALVAPAVTAVPATATTVPMAVPVCAIFCDTRDPALAGQDTSPVPDEVVNGRRVVLHVSDVDGMAWASIENGQPGDSVWLDRTMADGSGWEGLLGKTTGARTMMFNLYDPSHHRRGMIRACGDAAAVVCTDWAHRRVCADVCDGLPASAPDGDLQPIPETTLAGRRIALHFDTRGLAWATLGDGAPGDEVWLDRSWDGGASWPDGSSLGRVSAPVGTTSARTTLFHSRDTRGLLYGGALRACGRATDGPNGSCTAWARAPAPTPAARADAAAEPLMWSYDPYAAWWPSSWWNSAATLTTLIEHARRTGRTDYRWIIDRTFEVNRGTFPAGVRGTDPIEGDFISRAIDDAGWWALAWIAAYDLTGLRKYLDTAVILGNYMHAHWDPRTCNGGVWWNREHTYKNSVTNLQYIRLTAALHNRIPGDTAWLARATTGWTWFRNTGLINSAGLVNDGLRRSTCRNNGGTVWTYNQGLAIGAAMEMWRATADPQDLGLAWRLADAALASTQLVRAGVLVESCENPSRVCDDNQKQFKGLFMRYLAEFLDGPTGAAYRPFTRRQADTLWRQDGDPLNRLGLRWAGGEPNVRDWRTQASGLDGLLAGA